MEITERIDKNRFLYPSDRYHGQFQPEYLLFNANLQEFTQRASYIYNLQNTGKISPQEAFKRIEFLWKQLEQSKQQLGIGDGK
ncbi:hypothetical protein B7486_26615 [cyanobacterium TDX16]|nr:hypothetical protein B7486_26615 [cyanobacterium TDX16]